MINEFTRLSKEEKKILKYENLKNERRLKKQIRRKKRKEIYERIEKETPTKSDDVDPLNSTGCIISTFSSLKKARRVEGEQRLLSSRQSNTAVKIVIELSFDSFHDERERRSLCRQLQLLYGNLRNSMTSSQLTLCSFAPGGPIGKLNFYFI